MSDNNAILNIQLFKKVNPTTRQELIAYFKKKTYKKSSLLPPNLPPDNNFYYIVAGNVKLFQETAEGNEILIDILSEGNFWGEHILFELKFEPYQVQAISDLQLIVWPVSLFKKLLYKNQQLLINLLNITLVKQNELIMELEHHQTKTVEQRLGFFLLKLCNQQVHKEGEVMVKLPFDKAILAARLGMRPETFSRAMHKLCKSCNMINKGNIIHIGSIELLISEVYKDCSNYNQHKKSTVK